MQAASHGKEVRTVEGELVAALATILRAQAKKDGIELAEIPTIQGSGRTDSGVHARGQVASFRWPDVLAFDAERLRASLNALTPREMTIRAVEEAPDEFDARFTPHQKCYSYLFLLRTAGSGIYQGRAWRVAPAIDVAKMISAARQIVGTHDFESFRARDCGAQTTERTILSSQLTRLSDEELLYTVVGRGFLKQMIRIICGTLYDIGRGVKAADSIPAILAARSREAAGQTAPPDGLTLEWIKYRMPENPDA